jgi:Flp pilus assembly protein TadD
MRGYPSTGKTLTAMRLPALVLLAVTLPAFGADRPEQWVKLTTPHFELYTTAGEKSGRQAIFYFEQVRSFFTAVAPVSGFTEFPVRIIVFKSEKQYKPYTWNDVAFAYFTASRDRNYIVMQDAELEHFPVAIHEYMHLIVHQSKLKLPLWLNEGWADVYSTLKPVGAKTTIGELKPGYVQQLQQEKWLSFDALTSVDEKSPVYNEKQRAGIFYAESWALVHMLYLAPDYKSKFPTFVNTMLQGKTVNEAAQAAYGRSAAQVYADLKTYLGRNQLYGAIFPVKLTKSEEEAEASPVSPFESDLALADLLATINKRDQAQAAYEKLAAANPDKSEVQQSLGYLAWQHGDSDGARQYLEKSFAAGGADPQMCLHLAELERASGQPDDKIIPPLLRALKSRPDYIDARLELGFAELNARNFEGALASFAQLRNLPSDRAAIVYNGIAYAYTQTGDFVQARKNAINARKWDRTDAESRRTDDLIRYLDQREGGGAKTPVQVAVAQPDSSDRPTLRRTAVAESEPAAPREKRERVEGTAKNLDCSGEPARLSVLVGQNTMTFALADPDKIILKHDGNATFDFACGPQKPMPVTIEYVPVDNPAAKGVAGAVRQIEF